MPATLDAVRNYYDRNTRLFLRFSSPEKVQTIHRALWLLGVDNLEAALNVSNQLVLDEARLISAAKIADLGCGVGATLFYLIEDLFSPPHCSSNNEGSQRGVGFGLTLSHLQAQLAARAAEKLSLPNTHILHADFQSLPLEPGFDLVYSIEAFVHASEPDRYLSESARILRPGGRLAILDDFQGKIFTAERAENAENSKKISANFAFSAVMKMFWLKVYQDGWHAPNLRDPAEIEALAAKHELTLIENRDLTPFLRLCALPNWLARLILALFHPFWQLHPIVPSMLGSMALQQCLRNGFVQYRWLVFERRGCVAPDLLEASA